MLGKMRTPWHFIPAFLLVACAGPDARQAPEPTNRLGESVDKVETGVTEAATAPLADLNLRRGRIPAVLIEARKGPYLPPADQGCEGLAAELRELDAALGPDIDAPSARSKPGLARRGAAIVTDAATDAAKSAVQVAVPYRGWIRKLSGAEKYSEEVSSAIAAGGIRRAFLKGVRLGRGCKEIP